MGGRGVKRNKKPTPFLPEDIRPFPLAPALGPLQEWGHPCFLPASPPDLAWPGAELDYPGTPGKGETAAAAIPDRNLPNSPNCDTFLRGSHSRLVPPDVCSGCRQLSLRDQQRWAASAGSLALVSSHQINLIQQYKHNTHASSSSHSGVTPLSLSQQ